MAYRAIMYSLNAQFQLLGLVYNVVMGMCLGTILTGVGLLALRRWRGDPPSPLLPGHWLLIFGFAAALVDGVAIVVYRYVKPMSLNPPMAYWTPFRVAWTPTFSDIIQQSTGWGLGGMIALGFGWFLRRRLPRRWLIVVLGFFLAAAILAGGYILAIVEANRARNTGVLVSWCRRSVHVYAGSILLCTFAIAAAVGWDRLHGSRTDGLHWSGIAAWLTIAAIQIITYYFFMLT
jgi:hypothetical protein